MDCPQTFGGHRGALSQCPILFIHGNFLEEGSKHTSVCVQSQEQLEVGFHLQT